MRVCAEVGCSVREKQGFRLHKWPKDQALAAIWTKKVRRLAEGGKKAWTPTDTSVLCEKHFDTSQYVDLTTKKLKPGAIPTILCYSNVVPRRKSPRKRVVSPTPPTSPSSPSSPPTSTPVKDGAGPYTPRTQIKREHGYYRTRPTPKKKKKKVHRAILREQNGVPAVLDAQLRDPADLVRTVVDDRHVLTSPPIEPSFGLECQVCFLYLCKYF